MFRLGGGRAKKTCQLLRNQWKKFEFSLRISRGPVQTLVFSKFLHFALETMYSTKQLEQIHPQRYERVSFVEYLGFVYHRQDDVREKMDRFFALKWTGILEVWDCCRRWAKRMVV